MTVRPHDLLLLAAGVVNLPVDAPVWARTALRRTPWVVVRRAPAPDGHVAVGVRGASRGQRYGFYASLEDIRAISLPENLTAVVPAPDRARLPAMSCLAAARPALVGTGLAWGPTGSVGFELATTVPTITSNSDLDMVIRAPTPWDANRDRLTELHHLLVESPARIDCQVETVSGSIALAELVSESSEVLVRTETGPHLLERAALP